MRLNLKEKQVQKTAINLIDKIIGTNDKQECILSVMQLMLILKNLTIDEFQELKKYTEVSL
jgi:hypothetical protein